MSHSGFVQSRAVVFGVLLAACGGAEVGDRQDEREVWTVEGPTVRIGSIDDPDEAFGAVTGLAMSPDGTLHSLHRGQASVGRWDAQGRPAGTVGRAGEGPPGSSIPPV